MILNQLDFGGSHPWQAPVNGQMIGTAVVEGQATIGYARGSILRRYSVTFWAKAWQGIGGQTANSMAALRYLLKQGEELADNRELNPVYIQWSSSAESGAPLNAADQHDGWYNIESFKPDYLRLSSGLVPVQMTVAMTSTAPPRGLGQTYLGGALPTTYSGGSQIAIGYPFNAANQAATAVSRTGGEGAIPLSVAPAANLNPLPFTPSATLGDWWKGGVRVWDTINTGSNAVPLAGLYVNANWVEVFQSDHRFEGDCVVTNGLLLLIYVAGQSRVCRAYVWSTGLATPAWQQVGDLQSNDNASAAYTLRSYKVERIGLEETRIVTNSTTTGGNQTEVAVRLQRGAYFGRADVRPLSQASTVNTVLVWSFATNIKIAYNSTAISDPAVSVSSLGIATDYGYTAGFTANSAQPFISGLLNLNKPNAAPGNAVGSVNVGDTTTPLQNAIGNYALFVLPYGVNASYSPANLQAEGESGAFGAGWSSVADGAASAGNTAKAASGTLANSTNVFGTLFVPAPGPYDLWYRAKVTSAAGSGAEMVLAAYDFTAGNTTVGLNLAANAVTTSLAWYRVATNFTPTAGHQFQFRAATSATLGTDWFIDEAVYVPKSLTTAYTGPQDLWSQLLHDRTVRLTRI